jgi:hypothetical protein
MLLHSADMAFGIFVSSKLKTNLRVLSPRVNYTDRATSKCQLLRMDGAKWSA